eukprot:TRINITY_DN15242_c0_g1::TRINITY_DN15242_c0_g1_i1::g.30814::m.30814 TRINITY_DN15242_c0_g1::TRINITY_DN15242_c0_g1_i1::g.30814  ORF type:complete len:396 (+),score=6.06,sp/Q8VZ10/SOQ1_ARATH/31.76/2e-06,NHL/PF01436.16/1.5e+03,NHL/PF01436.16/0.92,NHL/PF01436.16/0.05,NHL/PF01436.16/18 TRINITY_DN15242_c0_g1_i1:55-1242(+)
MLSKTLVFCSFLFGFVTNFFWKVIRWYRARRRLKKQLRYDANAKPFVVFNSKAPWREPLHPGLAFHTVPFRLSSQFLYGNEQGLLVLSKTQSGPSSTSTLLRIAYYGNAEPEPIGEVKQTVYGLITDENNHIFMASTRRVILTFVEGHEKIVAGKLSVRDHRDGTASESRFMDPFGLAYDSKSKSLFISEYWSHCVRQLDLQSGVVSTLAGCPGEVGFLDADGKDARFNGVGGIALAPDRSVLVADCHNFAIRRISRKGVVSTFVHKPPDQPFAPRYLAVTSNGTIFASDYLNHSIYQITPDGIITSILGGTDHVDLAPFGLYISPHDYLFCLNHDARSGQSSVLAVELPPSGPFDPFEETLPATLKSDFLSMMGPSDHSLVDFSVTSTRRRSYT